jgi:glutathione S-transferase fosA5
MRRRSTGPTSSDEPARFIAECVIWRKNSSEGGSTYFLDPNGHKLEIHVGSLETRLAHYSDNLFKGVRVFDV